MIFTAADETIIATFYVEKGWRGQHISQELQINTKKQNKTMLCKVEKKSEIPYHRLYHEENHFFKNLMLSPGVSWNAETEIHTIDTNTTQLNADRY